MHAPFPESALPAPKKSSLVLLAVAAVLVIVGLAWYLFPPTRELDASAPAPAPLKNNPLQSLQNQNPFVPAH